METTLREELPQAGALSTALPRRGVDQDTNPAATEPVALISSQQEQERDGPMVCHPLTHLWQASNEDFHQAY
jgi:hypothetical protein